MAGGGSISGMIISLRNNAKLLRKRNRFNKESSFRQVKREYLKAAEGKLDLKKASPYELKRVREIVEQNRRESRKLTLIALFIVAPIVIYLGYSIQNYGSIYPQPSNGLSTEINHDKRRSEYLFLINDGDKYIEKKKWHNAIFQYSSAVKLYPKEFDANYRLSLAYTYSCSAEKINCSAANYTLQKLEKEFPQKSEVKELRRVLNNQ